MKPSELFGVVVRSLGLLIVLWAGGSLFWIILTCILGGPAPNNVVGVTVNVILGLFVGIWFLYDGPGLASLAYPEESKKADRGP